MGNREKVLLILAEYGEVKETRVVDGTPHQVVKDVIRSVLDIWNPLTSDLLVVRHKHEIRLRLPLTKEQYEVYSKYNLRRIGGELAAFEVPIYIVSYENKWVGNDLVDVRVVMVSPYIDEDVKKQLMELAESITSVEQEEET